MPLQGTGVDTLQFFGTSEGRARPNVTDTTFVYDYFLKDHLGNTRMVITDDYNVSSPILEATSYYPFGLQQKRIGIDAALPNQQNKKRYNGIEFDEDLSINMDEAFYRFHDPQIGRFLQIDPKIESADAWSPYSAMLDNPIINSDPLGDSTNPVTPTKIISKKTPTNAPLNVYSLNTKNTNTVFYKADMDKCTDGETGVNGYDINRQNTTTSHNGYKFDINDINGVVWNISIPGKDKVDKKAKSAYASSLLRKQDLYGKSTGTNLLQPANYRST